MPIPKEKRDYQAEYARESPERRANRRAKVQNRRAIEKKRGSKLPTDVHVDHIKPAAMGGALRDPKNLRLISASENLARARKASTSKKPKEGK